MNQNRLGRRIAAKQSGTKLKPGVQDSHFATHEETYIPTTRKSRVGVTHKYYAKVVREKAPTNNKT